MQLPHVKIGMRGNIVLFVVAIMCIFFMIVALFGTVLITHSLGYEGGWETRTELDSVYIASQDTWFRQSNIPAHADVPWSVKAVQFDPTPQTTADWDYVQEPDIYVRVDDPIHTTEASDHTLITYTAPDGAEKVTSAPLGTYVREIPKQIGNEMFYYYHHVYAFAVTVKTDADQKTALAYQSLLETKGEEGIALSFTVRVRFTVSPWNIVGDVVTDDSGQKYTVTTAWAGVMSSSYEIVDAGFTSRTMQARLEEKGSADVLATVNTGWDIIKAEEHSSCGMWRVDTTAAPNSIVTPESRQAILRIPQAVLIDLSGTLWPGADQAVFGEWAAMAVAYDLSQQITVRVDVLTAAGFTPVSGTDPLTDPPDDVKVGPAPFLYPLVYALGQIWEKYWWLVAMVIGIVFIVLVLIVASRIKALAKAFL